MGFYIRKSVRVGPLRFNFSQSGIGVSTGVPGFRIGTGPRGHYVYAGAHGIYYRASLGGRSAGVHHGVTTPSSPQLHQPSVANHDPTLGPEVTIGSGSVLGMSDSNSEGLLAELRARHEKIRLWPTAAVFTVAAIILASQRLDPLYAAILGVLGAAVTFCVQQWDQLRKSTVIYYHLQDVAEQSFSSLHDALTIIGRSQRVWHVQSTAAVLNAKYHAGAGSEIRRRDVAIQRGLPPFVKSNIEVPVVKLIGRTFYFFPDRLLVYDSYSVGAVGYDALQIRRGTTQFIESDGVPSDSQVVGHTWRYVNKNGGPDRRFNNNRQLPIALYETLTLQSGTGLNELLQVSRVGAGEALEHWLVSRSRMLGATSSPRSGTASQWWRE